MYPTEQSCKDVFAFDCIPEKEAVIKDLSSSESEVDELKEIIKKENGLEDVEKLVGECSTVLRHAKEKNPLTESRGIMENISKVEFGLDLLRQRLLSCAFYMLTPQEYSSLVEESQVSADPSVEFFGLEWTSVFRRFYKLGVELRLLKTGLQQNRICVERVHTCLSLIHGLTAETQMHGHAVSSGRLSSSNLSLQLKQQTVTQIGRTASFQNKQQTGLAAASTRGSKHKQSKYKGSRTDSALILKADSSSNANQTTEEKKKSSKQMPKSSRRKSSLMDSFSNIFHALKV